MNKLTSQDIDQIVKIFEGINIWNSGVFTDRVRQYCNRKNLDFKAINAQLYIAFGDVLATNITSQNAIRFRLKPLIDEDKS